MWTGERVGREGQLIGLGGTGVRGRKRSAFQAGRSALLPNHGPKQIADIEENWTDSTDLPIRIRCSLNGRVKPRVEPKSNSKTHKHRVSIFENGSSKSNTCRAPEQADVLNVTAKLDSRNTSMTSYKHFGRQQW